MAARPRCRWPVTCGTRHPSRRWPTRHASSAPCTPSSPTPGWPGPTAPLHEIALTDWRDCLATDLDGVFLTFRAFVPAMIAAGAGSLIAISSMTGKRPLHGRTPYAAAKMGVIGLVRTLALELGPHGIRVNAVCPGAVAGPRIDDVIRLPGRRPRYHRGRGPRRVHRRVAARPARRGARRWPRRAPILASDRAASITGEDLNVTAGVVMY